MKKLIFASLLFASSVAQAAGPKVVALPKSRHGSVAIELQFRAGAVDDPAGKAGLTALTATVMADGGTRALDARQLLDALFPMAASVSVRVDKELTTFRTHVHRDHLKQMVPILTDVVAHPRWDEKELQRLRDAAVNDIEKRLRQGEDENLGKEVLSELMYRGHPYGRLTHGHLADLKSITMDDLKAQAARVFTRDRLTIGVAGDYDDALVPQIEKALASLPATGAPPIAVPAAAPAKGPRVLLVEKDVASTAISIGFPWALSRRDPDFVAMTIARSAFGEHRQFNGRLMQRLREDRGLNYGDYAYLEYFQQEGGEASTAQTGRVRHQQNFTIWLRPVQNENRLFAARAALYELQRSLTDEPFSKEEVESTKAFLAGYTLLFAQTDARRLGYALDDDFLGTQDFLGEWRKALAAVTPEQVNAAWRKWIDPARAQLVLVTRGAGEVKRAILSDAPTPVHYQKDAQGQSPPKPKEQLAADARAEKFSFGAKGDAAVEIIPVEKLFE